MATSRRGIKESLKASSTKMDKFSPRHRRRTEILDNIDDEISDSDGDFVGHDETDSCVTSSNERYRNSHLPLIEHPDSPNFEAERTYCERSTVSSSKREHKPFKSRLYPDLRDLENEDKKKPDRHTNGIAPVILIGLILLLIFLLFFVGHFVMNTKTTSLSTKKPLEKIFEEMKSDLTILSKQTDQSKQFWIQLLSQMEILTELSPLQPAIILAIVPSDAQRTAACLSQHILQIIATAFEDAKSIAFDVVSHSLRNANATLIKHDLDDSLQGLTKAHAAAIYNLEKLHPEAAMILHAYCDNENAPHKRALFLLTLQIDLSYSTLAIDRLDSTVYNYLMELWTGFLREDDAAAIISRISNAPVVFRPEQKGTIDLLCEQ